MAQVELRAPSPAGASGPEAHLNQAWRKQAAESICLRQVHDSWRKKGVSDRLACLGDFWAVGWIIHHGFCFPRGWLTDHSDMNKNMMLLRYCYVEIEYLGLRLSQLSYTLCCFRAKRAIDMPSTTK